MRDLETVKARCLYISDDGGAFVVPSPIDRAEMPVIASFGMGWDHVSVSRKNRVPNWAEMEHVKRLFFKDDEAVVQFHVPVAEHVSMHSTTLHLWRCQTEEFPRPPSILVGVGKREATSLEDAKGMVREAIASGEIPPELVEYIPG